MANTLPERSYLSARPATALRPCTGKPWTSGCDRPALVFQFSIQTPPLSLTPPRPHGSPAESADGGAIDMRGGRVVVAPVISAAAERHPLSGIVDIRDANAGRPRFD